MSSKPHVCGTVTLILVATERKLAGPVYRARSDFCIVRCSSILRILLLHIADDGLPTIVHMNVLDADKLLAAVTQASKNLNLRRISPH